MTNMDLDTAYEIVGGYKDADDKTFDEALEIVRKKDEELAKLCKEARDSEIALKIKIEEEEALKVSAKVLANNTAILYQELETDNLDNWLLNDEEVKEALNNTPIVDTNEDGAYTVSGEERDNHIKMLVEKAKLDTLCEQSRTSDFSEMDEEEKQNTLRSELKTSFLGTLMHLRTSALILNDVPNASKAFEEDNEEFFKRQQEALANMEHQDVAADFSQSVEVPADLVITSCVESEAKASKFAKKLSDLSLSAKGKTKTYLEQASGLIHKAKISFVKKAKEVWGQRYEFANNLRDRAPKVITDTVATIGLIGATAMNAPWLGTAVVAYGAYKAASSWVWPIITKARKEARLDKAENKNTKVKFMDRLRNASNTIFGNKEERKEYIKEASWGSAAGLVGLGAAGAVASSVSGAASAVAARGAQRLASMAVSSVSGLMNTVKTMKNKKKDWWDKGAAVLGFAATVAIFAGCIEGCEGGHDASPSTNLNDATPPTDDLTTLASEKEGVANGTDSLNVNQTDVDSLATNDNVVTTVSEEATKEVAEVQTVSAPTEWSQESGITARQWNRLQSFWGGAEKYQEYYSKITDDMLQPGGAFEGMTRDEVLFKYERMSSWNLLQHRDDIAKFDKFFECGTYQLTADDGKVLDVIMDDGSVLGVKGDADVYVTGRDVDCGDNDVLHTQKVVRAPVENVIEATPATEEVAQSIETATTGAQDTFDNIGGTNTQITNEVSPDVDVVKANNLSNGVTVNQISGDEISAEAENRNVVTDASTETPVTTAETKVEVTAGVESDLDGSSAPTETPVVTAETKVEVTAGTESDLDGSSAPTETTVVTTETKVEASSDNTDTIVVDWENAEVVANSEDVAEGTPAAGNVEERGGYNNTGITESQYNATQTFFKDRYGDNAYDLFSAMITDEMRAKGAIFEGLSVEQSMFSVKQMVAWSNDQHGEFSQEITATVDYLKGCKGEISPEIAPQIKEVIDRVNENGTIDGVTGTKSVMVRYFQVGDCGQPGTYAVENASQGVTNPSTDGFDRLFLRPKVTVVSNAPINEFDEVAGQSYDAVKEEDYDIDIVKSNNLTGGTVVSEDVNADEINTNATNRTIVTDKTIAIPTGRDDR